MSYPHINCKYYGSMRGCIYGNNCIYNHSNPNSVPLCHYYNNCKYGNSCKFRHINFNSIQQSQYYFEPFSMMINMGNKPSSPENNADILKQIYTDKHDMNQFNKNNQNSKYEFTVCSFNIWCPYWNDANGLESSYKDRWMKRHNNILQILSSSSNIPNNNDNNNEIKIDNNIENKLDSINADIYCLQEFWCDNNDFINLYNNYLKPKHYALHYLKRNAKHKPDGIAILINEKVFKLINKIDFKYNSSNRVALMMQLEHINSGMNIKIGNTHFTFPNGYNASSRESLCNQFIDLMDTKKSKQISLTILCGDYNCDINQTECILCLNKGYKSSFHIVNKQINEKLVSHITHKRQSVFVDHIFYKRNTNVDNKFGIKAIGSYLYPKDVGLNKWPNDKQWNLSDHRPLVTTFQLQQM
eukprot:353816_1